MGLRRFASRCPMSSELLSSAPGALSFRCFLTRRRSALRGRFQFLEVLVLRSDTLSAFFSSVAFSGPIVSRSDYFVSVCVDVSIGRRALGFVLDSLLFPLPRSVHLSSNCRFAFRLLVLFDVFPSLVDVSLCSGPEFPVGALFPVLYRLVFVSDRELDCPSVASRCFHIFSPVHDPSESCSSSFPLLVLRVSNFAVSCPSVASWLL